MKYAISTFTHTLLTTLTRILLLLAILTLALSLQYLHAWTGPQSSAPTCATGQTGCDAPLNVGTTNQTKSGGLTVGGGAGGFAVLASQYIQGKLGIGSGKASPAYLIDLGGVAGTDGIRFPDGTVQVSAGGKGTLVNSISAWSNGSSFASYGSVSCAAGYVLTGCSSSGNGGGTASPSGNGCAGLASNGGSIIAICAKVQ